MNKIFLSILLIAALVLVSGCTQGGQNPTTTSSPTPSPTQTATTTTSSTPILPPTPTETEVIPTATPSTTTTVNIVEATSSGFTPSTITVKAGEFVTFTNKDTAKHWPASAVHPTHKVYPGSDIAKCSDPVEKTKIFDACKGLEKEESWSFTFNEKGTWKYHDHLNTGSTGTIVVE
ncbi:MAG TPA: hypothetical protein VJA47_06010 [archaeon]|nr:hypothetical protein [archaeon]